MNITKWHCSQPHQSFLIQTGIGKLPGSNSSTVSVDWICLYHVSAYSLLSVFVDNLHGRQWVAPVILVDWMQLHVSMSIYRNTRSIYWCDKCVINDTVIDSYINTMYIPWFHARGPLSWSMWGSLRLAPIMYCFCTTDISGTYFMHLYFWPTFIVYKPNMTKCKWNY